MNEQLSDIAKKRIEEVVKGMTLQEQEHALRFFRTELIWNETERRMKDALEYKARMQKAMEG